MANFRTTADILDSILTRCGEVTSGRSAFEARALNYLNKINHAIIAGGNEFEVEINETWTWAKAKLPMVLELQPAYETGTVALVQGSNTGTLSVAPSYSLKGWFLRTTASPTVYRIGAHTASSTTIELDGLFAEDNTTTNYSIFKLDYELITSHITIDDSNNKLDFEESAGVEITATLTLGVYTPSELAAEIQTQLNAAGASDYTVTYSSLTREFILASDLAGGSTFKLLFATGTNARHSVHVPIGFDDLDRTSSASHTSVYILGGICRLVEPFTVYRGNNNEGSIYGIDPLTFKTKYPQLNVHEGYPTRFTKVREDADGAITVRMNAYPERKTRVEIDFIPVPRDLQDNAISIPIVPRKYIDVLEDGTASEVLFEKEDSKWEGYAMRTGAKLKAMILQNRTEQFKIGQNFGQTVAREDMVSSTRRKLRYGIPEDN